MEMTLLTEVYRDVFIIKYIVFRLRLCLSKPDKSLIVCWEILASQEHSEASLGCAEERIARDYFRYEKQTMFHIGLNWTQNMLQKSWKF